MVEYTFQTFDGIELFGKTDAVRDPLAAVVIVHGLCEHQGRYDYLTARLNAQGISVYRFDHRGHGRSSGQPIYYGAFDEIAKDIDVVVDRAIGENPFTPIYIIGHSMGGYGAALYGHLHPEKVDGYVLSGAWTRDNKGLGASALAAPNGDLDYMPNELGDGVCSDPSVGEAYLEDPLVVKKISFGLFRALHAGHDYMREHAQDFCDPVLVLHGGDDGLVDPKDSLELFQEISSADKSLHIFAGLYHEIFNEYEKDKVIEEAIDWIEDHASAFIDFGGLAPEEFDALDFEELAWDDDDVEDDWDDAGEDGEEPGEPDV